MANTPIDDLRARHLNEVLGSIIEAGQSPAMRRALLRQRAVRAQKAAADAERLARMIEMREGGE